MPYYAYIIELTSKKGTTTQQAGFTGFITSPIASLATNLARNARGRTVELVYAEVFRTEAAAAQRYQEIKEMPRRAKSTLIVSGCDVLI
jgi:ferredoxin-NADP reductase